MRSAKLKIAAIALCLSSKIHKSSFVNKSWWLMACYVYIDNNSTRSTLFCLLRPSAHYFNTFYVFLCLHFFSNAFLSHSHNEIHFRGMSAAVHSVSACLSVCLFLCLCHLGWCDGQLILDVNALSRVSYTTDGLLPGPINSFVTLLSPS